MNYIYCVYLALIGFGAAVGIIGCMLGDFVGKRVFNKLDSKKLKLIIYVGMIISGIAMLF